jgi:hypothetical protein
MKSIFSSHIANGIRRQFIYTSFANISHFLSQLEKQVSFTFNNLNVESIEDNIFKLTIDFGEIKAEIELTFKPSKIRDGRITLQEVKAFEPIESKKGTIDGTQASEMLMSSLEHLEISDSIYEMAQGLCDKSVNDIELKHKVVDADGEEYDGTDGEMWYDSCREDFVKAVYEKIKSFFS